MKSGVQERLVVTLLALGACLTTQAQSFQFNGALSGIIGGFIHPAAVAADSRGNLYVADAGAGAIYQLLAVNGSIPSSPVIRTLALDPNGPVALAVGVGGNVYVADGYTPAVFQIAAVNGTIPPSPAIQTLTSSIAAPIALAVDAAGNLYVADQASQSVDEIQAVNGVISSTPTIATLATGFAFGPYGGIAVDGSGNVYVASQGTVEEVVAVAGNVPPVPVINVLATNFGALSGAQVDGSGNVFVSDAALSTISEIVAVNGSIRSSPAIRMVAGGLGLPVGVALDQSGNIYFPDPNAGVVNQIQLHGVNFGQQAIGATSAARQLTFTLGADSNTPVGSIAILTGGAAHLDFSDGGSSTCTSGDLSASTTCSVSVNFTPVAAGLRSGAVVFFSGAANTGVVLGSVPIFGVGTGPQAGYSPATASVIAPTVNNQPLLDPTALTMDGAGDLFIADGDNNRVVEVAAGGVVTAIDPSVGGSGLNHPTGVALDGAGNIYIADQGNSRVVMIPAAGGAATVVSPSINGSSLSSPVSVAVNGAGDLFVADSGNAQVLKVPSNGDGAAVISASVNGVALGAPAGMALDGAGDLFIADTSNNRIVEVPADGGAATAINAIVNGIPLMGPSAIAVDAAGDLFASGTGNPGLVEVLVGGSAIAVPATVNGQQMTIAPAGLYINEAGDLFVADRSSAAVIDLHRSQPPTTKFGTVTNVGSIDSTDGTQTLSILNLGNEPLLFSAIGFPADFSASTADASVCTPSSGIAAGQTCNLFIQFTPQTAGSPLVESLSLTDNALNVSGSQQALLLTATGAIATTTTTLTSSQGASVFGQPVSFQAKVTQSSGSAAPGSAAPGSAASGSAAPDGSVQFIVDGNPLGSPMTLSEGIATLTTSSLTAVVHSVSAQYAPATGNQFAGSSSPAISQAVRQATPIITFSTPPAITYGNPLTTAQLSATSSVTGAFAYSPAAGSVLPAGTQTLSVTLTPADAVDYATASASVQLVVKKAAPLINWPTPSAIPYGVPLGSVQLNATANVGGAFVYSPSAGAPLSPGAQVLTVTFTPANGANYTSATASVTLVVNPLTPAALATPIPNAGTALGASAAFAWTAGTGVAAYQLQLGTTGAGSSNLYNSGSITTTARTVSGLPLNGVTVYARLSSQINGAWQSLDYTYMESTPTPATLITPAPALTTILGTSNAAFQWTAGVGVTEYELFIGTTGAGSKNLFNSAGTYATSAVVPSLQAGGVTVYVRLYSLINGAWQYNDYLYTESGTPSPAILTAPAPSAGAALGASNVTFQWTPGNGVTEYELFLGTLRAGSNNLYNSSGTYATSAVVPSLPAGGVTVYARLYSQINGVWQYNDYLFTEAGEPTPAAMTTPAPGLTTVLGTGNLNFQWTAGSGPTEYELFLGTGGVGSNNLFNSGGTYATSVVVPALPATGATVYARLYSLINGAWQSNDYVYTESRAVAAVLTSPPPGQSTLLGSSSVTFQWTAGNLVTAYQLTLGTTGPGSSNVYSTGSIAAAAAVVPSIPINGSTVYARLSSQIGGAWQFSDYVFTESSPTPAALITPAQGSATKLGAGNITFQWSAGIGVAEYELFLGTLGAGSSNLYNSGGTHATSTIVSGVPQGGAPVYARLYSQINGVWQSADYLFTEAGSPSPAALTSPAPGTSTVLKGSNVTFQWTAGLGVTEYELFLGTQGAGSHNLYNSGGTYSTSVVVPSLPSGGVTVYARLYSQINGAWQFTDYLYTEPGVPSPATLITPAPNASTVLGIANVAFQWTSGAGVTEYEFFLGTTGPGSNDLFNSGGTYATSALVPSLPSAGATVYARVYSLINGAWQSADYVYNESLSIPAALITPTPSPATLLGVANVGFQWTAGNLVAAYQLQLGTAGVGSSNLFNSGATTATSTLVASLPSNGATVYARLSSQIGGTWRTADYIYTESTPIPAVLTSPTPGTGTVLSTSNVAFQWTAGSLVTAYQLLLGTTGAGSSDLYSSGPMVATSVLVPGVAPAGYTVYARLSSRIAGTWQSNDYLYTEAGSFVPAALTSPVPGPSTALGTSNIAFQWTSGNLVTAYQLQLGTTGPGSQDLYNSGPITSTSATAPTVPSNGGTVYATLSSLTRGNWVSVGYVYGESAYAIDSVNGSDANNCSLASPCQTIARLQAMDAANPLNHWCFVPGSVFTTTLNIGSASAPRYGLTLDACGLPGTPPMFDGSTSVAPAQWAETTGQPNVYQVAATIDVSSNAPSVNIFENGVFLPRATSLANCSSTPGTYFVSSDAGPSITLYVHPTGGASPASNGNSYAYTARVAPLNAQFCQQCILSGLASQRGVDGLGSTIIGANDYGTNLVANQGSKHNFYIEGGTTLTNSTATDDYWSAGSPILFVCYDAVATLPCTFSNDAATMTAADTIEKNAAGFYTHAGMGTRPAINYINDTATNVIIGYGGVDVAAMNVTNSTVALGNIALGTGIAPVDPTYIQNSMVTGSGSSQNCVQIPAGTAGTSITITGTTGYTTGLNCSLTGPNGVGISSQFNATSVSLNHSSIHTTGASVYLSGMADTFIATQSQFKSTTSYPYYLAGTGATITSNSNDFPTTFSGLKYLAVYPSLAAWINATGQDANSTQP